MIIVIAGRPFQGKTRWIWSSMNELLSRGKVVYIALDENLLQIDSQGRRYLDVLMSQVDQKLRQNLIVKTKDEFRHPHHLSRFINQVIQDKEVKTIIIDSATGVADLILLTDKSAQSSNWVLANRVYHILYNVMLTLSSWSRKDKTRRVIVISHLTADGENVKWLKSVLHFAMRIVIVENGKPVKCIDRFGRA